MLTSLESVEPGAHIEARLREVELVAVDMDGTLLTDDKRISSASRDAIDRVLAKGVRVVPTSGRLLTGLPQELFDTEGIEYAVCNAGASIEKLGKDRASSETLHAIGFTPDGAAGVVALLLEQFGTDIFIDVSCAGEMYTTREQLDLLSGFDLTGLSLPYILESRRVLPDLIEGIKGFKEPIGRVNIFGCGDSFLHEVMDWLARNTPYELANSLEHNIEINAPGTSKWNGLTWLCEHLGIRPDRIMAIGDGANDREMIRHAWLGVAMRNAAESLQRDAAAVTSFTNNEDGVAHVLNEMLLLKA